MRKTGFTLVEILLALAILLVVSGMTFYSLSRLNTSAVLDKGVALAVSVIDEARTLTFSAKGDSQYGVHFEDSNIILFKGSSYAPSSPDNVITSLDNRIAIKNITLSGGGSDVIFKRLTGETDQAGTLEIYLKSSPDDVRAVRVQTTGVVEADL